MVLLYVPYIGNIAQIESKIVIGKWVHAAGVAAKGQGRRSRYCPLRQYSIFFILLLITCIKEQQWRKYMPLHNI